MIPRMSSNRSPVRKSGRWHAVSGVLSKREMWEVTESDRIIHLFKVYIVG